MSIVENREGSKLTLSTGVRLDATSAPQLAEKIEHIVYKDRTVKLLVIDMSSTIYISSLGLRVLLQGVKLMKSLGGNLSIQNITSQIRSVFEMTGLMELMVREEKLIILQKEEARTSTTLSLVGKLTDETIMQFETEIHKIADKYADIYLDCSNLKFISNNGFKALSAARDHISKNGNGVLMLLNFPEGMKRLLVAEKLEELLYHSVIVKLAHNKVFFSLIGCVNDSAVSVLCKYLDQILENKRIKEIYFYLENLITVSKQVMITLVELGDKLVKNGITVKLTLINPEHENLE
jgi:anti-sigma B factor antagonist